MKLTRRVLPRLALLLTVLYVWAAWLFDRESDTAFDGYDAARVHDIIEGTASRPFVTRALLPWTLRSVRNLLPPRARESLENPASRVMSRLQPPEGQALEFLLAACAVLAFLFGFALLVRSMSRQLYDGPSVVHDLAPIAALLGLLPFFKQGTHFIYDLPVLFFGTCLFSLMFASRWRLYYPVFLLACLNKETTIFVTLAFAAVYAGRLALKELALHLCAQLGLWGAAKAWLEFSYAGNPGSALQHHLKDNLKALLVPIDGPALLLLTAGAVVLYRGWYAKPLELRRAALVAVPVLGAYLLHGILGEIRVFFELYPLLVFLALPTLGEALGWHIVARQGAGVRPHAAAQ